MWLTYPTTIGNNRRASPFQFDRRNGECHIECDRAACSIRAGHHYQTLLAEIVHGYHNETKTTRFEAIQRFARLQENPETRAEKLLTAADGLAALTPFG
jgi:hypothetical protein